MQNKLLLTTALVIREKTSAALAEKKLLETLRLLTAAFQTI